MNFSSAVPDSSSQYELRFPPLSRDGRSYAFPCDRRGEVHIDALNERARNDYFYARACIGHSFSWPQVAPRESG